MRQPNVCYDDEGNRPTKTKISTGEKEEYTWDHRNRLTKITFKNSGGTVLKTVDQTYDVFNQWIRRQVDNDGPGSGAAVDTFFSHEAGQVALQFGGTTAASLSHRYLWNPAAVDQLLADEAVTSLSSAGTVQYPLGDHLGTLRDLATYNATTNTTTIANHRRNGSYGNLTSETNAAVDQIFGYTGKALDDSTNQQNNLHRWYDPPTGLWLSEDPIGLAGDPTNLTRYVGNAPTRLVDPSGLHEAVPQRPSPGSEPTIGATPHSLVLRRQRELDDARQQQINQMCYEGYLATWGALGAAAGPGTASGSLGGPKSRSLPLPPPTMPVPMSPSGSVGSLPLAGAVFPPNGGFLSRHTTITLPSGFLIDRYGPSRGFYASPAGVPFVNRTLPPGTYQGSFCTYRVMKPIDRVDAGYAAPGFGQPGFGPQFRFGQTIQDLVDSGHLQVVK